MALAMGLDIGSGAVKAALVERKGAELRLLRVLHLTWEELEERGIAPDDEMALALAIKESLRSQGWKRARICLGLASRQSMLRYLPMPVVPPWRLKLIANYEVGQVAEQAGESLSADYATVRVPEPEVEGEDLVLIAMARDREIDDRLRAYNQVGLPIHGVLPGGIAVFNAAMAGGQDPEKATETALYLDIGHQQTEMSIASGDSLIYTRNLPVGAVRLEEEGGLEKLIQAIKTAFPYAKSQTKWPSMKPERIVLSGGGSAKDGESFDDLLSRRLGIPVERQDLAKRCDTSALPAEQQEILAAHGPSLTVAVGLAATQLGRGFRLDLLPNEYKRRRKFRTETVYLIAAGALIALYLIYGLTASSMALSDARAREAELKKQRAAIIALEEKNSELEARNLEKFALLAELSRRSELGYSYGRMLLVAVDRLPSRVRMSAYSMAMDADNQWFLHVEGEADNRDGKGWDRLQSFKSALQEESEVAEVRDISAVADAEKSTIRYQLRVRPELRPGG